MIVDHPAPVGRNPPPTGPLYWICQAVGWFGFCAYVTVGYLYGSGQHDGKSLFNIALFTLGFCPMVSHGMRWWMWRRGWVDLLAWKRVPRVSLMVIVLAVILTTTTAISLMLLYGPPVMPAVVFTSMTLSYGLALGGWSAIYFGVLASRRHEQVQASARAAQLQLLKSQLNPHFLFNCMNSVRALIKEDPDRASTMLTGLADLLRYSLASDRQHTVTLADELAVVDEYIALERMRFEERLRVVRTVDPEALQARVPPMLVQTLVENAVKHGISDSVAGGEIALSASVVGDRVQISVVNTGAFKSADEGQGHGLRNARERLRLMYGGFASLTVGGRGGDTVATLLLPLGGTP